MTSLQWFRFCIAFSKFVPLNLESFSKVSHRVVVRPLLRGPLGYQSFLVGYFIMAHHDLPDKDAIVSW